MSIHQLYNASRRFPDAMIQRKQGNDYVDHAVITQRIMQVFGWFDQEIVREIRGHVPEWKPGTDDEKPALDDAITGVVLRITVHTDDGPRSITEIGEVEFPHNHTTDASRAKHATSDAVKRCAMRLGIGLHLWAQGLYTLDSSLYAQLHEDDEESDEGEGVPEPPDPSRLPVDPDAPDDADEGEPDVHAGPGSDVISDETPPESAPPKQMRNPDGPPTNPQKTKLRLMLVELGVIHLDEETGELDETIYRAAFEAAYGVDSLAKVTKKQASTLIDQLENGNPEKDRTPEQVVRALIKAGAEYLDANDEEVPAWAQEATS